MRPYRRRSIVSALALAAALSLGSLAAPASADDGAPSASAAMAAAQKVRAAIPEPVEPEEGKGKSPAFEWKGDLVKAGENAGSVTIDVSVGEYHGAPVWIVTETVIDEWAGTKRTTESSYFLSRDLSLEKAEWKRSTPDQEVDLRARREGDEIVIKSETSVAAGGAEPVKDEKRLPLEKGATFGWGARLLFLKYAPPAAADYELPVAPLDAAMPKGNEHEAPLVERVARLVVAGVRRYGAGDGGTDALLAIWSRGNVARGPVEEAEVYLEPKSRTLLAVEYRRPFGVRFVPKGKGGERVEYADDQPAKSWRACFLKFGHGYHLAVARWIDAAIHWPSIYEHDAAEDPDVKKSTVEEHKQAWIEEFLRRSKHRTRSDADGLLQATIATGEEKKGPDGTVILATHPEFGGNTFHFKRIGDVWFIVRIDQ